MNQKVLTISENRLIAKDTYKMVLTGDASEIKNPGQFVNIKLDGFFLRRPISVCEYTEKTVVLIYKAVGKGTRFMSELSRGDKLDVLLGLGNGYDTGKSGGAPLLIGGGAGIPPLYALCKKLAGEGKRVSVVLGFNSKGDVFYENEFTEAADRVYVATADGTYGLKGFVTDVIKDLEYSYFYACGPKAMFDAVNKIAKTRGQYSFEERMGCGFGACMGCTCNTLSGAKRICKEGPVLESEEIIWEN